MVRFLNEESRFATEKTPGGKLVGVEAWVSHQAISKVKLTGDFFLHPEDSLDELEKALEGVSINFDIAAVERQLNSLVEEKGLVLVGITPYSIASVLKKAIEGRA